MKRRDLILATGAVAAGAGVTSVLAKPKTLKTPSKPASQSPDNLSTPYLNKGLKEFRMATSWPKDFPGLGQMANRFAEGLGRISEGRLKVKVFAAGELVGATECFDAVFPLSIAGH